MPEDKSYLEKYSSFKSGFYDSKSGKLTISDKKIDKRWYSLDQYSFQVGMLVTAIKSLDDRFPEEFKKRYLNILSNYRIIQFGLNDSNFSIVAVRTEQNDCILGIFDKREAWGSLQEVYFGTYYLDKGLGRVIEVSDFVCREDFASVPDESDTKDYLGFRF